MVYYLIIYIDTSIHFSDYSKDIRVNKRLIYSHDFLKISNNKINKIGNGIRLLLENKE